MASNPVDGIALRVATLRWVNSQRIDTGAYGRYRFTSQGESTLLSSCFAALVRELFGDLASLSHEHREQWIKHIRSHQDVATGKFLDPQFQRSDLTDPIFSKNYLTMQFTYFSIAALDALGAEPSYPLRFAEPFANPLFVVDWLDSRYWPYFWLESNKIMFILSFLLHQQEAGDSSAGEAVEAALDWLDDNQDPCTGFWGTDRSATLYQGMGGAFHIFPFYFYLGRPVKYLECVIGSTLSLQQSDGLFDPRGGGMACADLDAIDMLVKFSLVTDYRASDIKTALAKAFDALLECQSDDGGFREAKGPRRKSLKRMVGEALFLDVLLGKQRGPEIVRYSAWDKMAYRADRSDMWSTWFRPLALALISLRYPGEFISGVNWHFRRVPCLGWHDPVKVKASVSP